MNLLTREEALGRIGHVEARELVVEWTAGGSSFLVLNTATTEAIVVERRPTTLPTKWSMLFLWQMGGKWVLSADVQNGTAEDVLAAIARRLP